MWLLVLTLDICFCPNLCIDVWIATHAPMRKVTLIARFMGSTWGPYGADRTQVGPMLAPWTLLFGKASLCAEDHFTDDFYRNFNSMALLFYLNHILINWSLQILHISMQLCSCAMSKSDLVTRNINITKLKWNSQWIWIMVKNSTLK